MPAKDRYHETVKRALEKDGWEILDEQVNIRFGNRNLWIDLQAAKTPESLVILIEIKELEEVASPIDALASALGKYRIYRKALKTAHNQQPLYMAVTEAAYNHILSVEIVQQMLAEDEVLLVIFNPHRAEIVRWIP